ncbi:p53-like transcription factor [Myriangium duriaei CBS 260.36]|uniref:P53-like transcription factor n=1 Tax=Myriangium duriaei CBS 260.36 TaxID=1168546 RepID=A0A9P4MG45_9PEZI|nr:p53-like transcription factor [Myriangium duriaei CBS 260.36]
MEGFDTSTMTYMASTMPVTNVTDHDGFSKPAPVNMDMQDMFSNFDMSTYAGSEDFAFHGMQPAISPGLKRMQSGFDDAAYSDIVSTFDTQTNHEHHEAEAIDRDNKLLSFCNPTFDHVLLDYTFRQTTLSLSAKLHGMFFLAESPWTSTGDAVPPPHELTCYRRNLFQITGNITLPRTLRHLLTEKGEQLPIVGQELTVSATESTEGNPVKIISVPWKTPVNPTQQPGPEDKAEREPPAIPLDPMATQDLDPEFAQIPFQWKRLQFRIATANNGRRKELQQHFVIRLKVMATLADGSKRCICEVRSGAVIVRGRSPRNFQSRKDTPLNGNASHTRKPAPSIAPVQRTTSGDSVAKSSSHANASNTVVAASATTIKPEVPHAPPSVQSFFESNDVAGGQDFYDGLMSGSIHHHGAMTAVPQEPFSFDRHRAYAGSSPDFGRVARHLQTSSTPINLSLVDEDVPRKEAMLRDSSTPSKRPIMPPPRPPSFSFNTVSTPDESADLLYEYFPLALEEWMPPVDAVYRPHVVHHIKVSADPRDPTVGVTRGRSKRYFSEVAG